MLFNIDVDQGSRIVGYVVPDNFSESSSVRITDGARDVLVLPCQEERAALVYAGRHGNGRCGFTIDETIIADLSRQEALEIYDHETNILIYRRRPPSQVTQKRVFRLETHLIPLWRIDDKVERHFQYFYKGIERHGLETATQMFLLNNSSSLYLSGRLNFRSYELYINETFNCVAVLRDPYRELAERLLALKLVRKSANGAQLLGMRDMLSFAPAIDFAEAIEIDEKALHRAFATMPPAAIANLANPVTRQLASRNPDEVPRKGAVAIALGTLSRFAIVGLRERQDLFRAQLGELVGADAHGLPEMPSFNRTAELCEQLKFVPEAQVLIEQDLEVYFHVKSAIEAALSDP
jgi:hypothetical protein